MTASSNARPELRRDGGAFLGSEGRRAGRRVGAVEAPLRRTGDVDHRSRDRTFGFSQLYLSLGDIAADGTTTVRVFWKPLVTLIWLGAIVMALGGCCR